MLTIKLIWFAFVCAFFYAVIYHFSISNHTQTQSIRYTFGFLFNYEFCMFLRWTWCSTTAQFNCTFNATCWIDYYYGILYVEWRHCKYEYTVWCVHSVLNGFNSKVVHKHSTTHYYLFIEHFFSLFTTFSNIIFIDRSFHNWYGFAIYFVKTERKMWKREFNWTSMNGNQNHFNTNHCGKRLCV